MNELQSKWIDALRSGEYSQATHQLRSETGFCCLGVLCDVLDSRRWVGERFLTVEPQYPLATCSLPKDVRERAEVTFIVEGHCIHMNDSLGKSFVEIADYLEKQFTPVPVEEAGDMAIFEDCTGTVEPVLV
jgi:hypothetical protein